MSTLKERVNEYLTNVSTTQNARRANAVIPESEDNSYWKFREEIDQQHEQESLELLQKRFHH